MTLAHVEVAKSTKTVVVNNFEDPYKIKVFKVR